MFVAKIKLKEMQSDMKLEVLLKNLIEIQWIF